MTSKKTVPDRLVVRCLGLVLHRTTNSEESGPSIFSDFLRQNSQCFWNGCLTRSVAGLEYKGCVVPDTILVSGSDFALEVVRSAWARRVLRPPKGYAIVKLGDVGPLDLSPVPQTQFAPLSEALCVCVGSLNPLPASAPAIQNRLEAEFPEMRPPSDDILHSTLGQLVRERKLCHTGEGYLVVGPDTYLRRTVSPVCERQMLMTNEEAIVRMHGDGEASALSTLTRRRDVSCQITQVPPSPDLQYLERSHSLKILRKSRPKSTGGSFKENSKPGDGSRELLGDDMRKTEKQSMLAKILRRMQSLTEKSSSSSNKHLSFSAQFPPLEWLDTAKFHGHSVATQTALAEQSGPTQSLNREFSCSRVPWGTEADREMTHYFYSNGIPKGSTLDDPPSYGGRKNVLMRQGSSRHSPTHRYSHGAFTNHHSKRRHRHRRSSSESPKIHKNGSLRTDTPGSKSPTDHSDAKISMSSSSGGYALTNPNPKAIVNPRLKFFQDSPSKQKPIGLSNTLPYRRNGGALDYKTTKDLFTYSPKLPAKDLFTYSPKLSKQVYHPETKTARDYAMYSPKVSKPVLNTTPNHEAKKEDNQTTNKINQEPSPALNKPNSLTHQDISKRNNVNCKNSFLYRPASETRNEYNRSSNSPKCPVLKEVDKRNNVNTQKVPEPSPLTKLIDAKLAPSESFSDISFNDGSLAKKDEGFKPTLLKDEDLEPIRKTLGIKPLVLKSFVDPPPKPPIKCSPMVKEIKEVIVDNSVSVEVSLENKSPSPTGKKGNNNNNVSTTIVTEETTVTNGKGNSKVVTTVTSITTSLSQGGIKDLEKLSPPDKEISIDKDKMSVNDLNIENEKGSRVIDCSSSCNIVTEVK